MVLQIGGWLMLRLLEIENYQSLRDVRLELGKFTVIVGPTGSGKTAVLRALRTLCFNGRGTSYIRRGAKTCKVMLLDDQGLGVALVRGGRGSDSYVLDVLGQQKTFTKLGGDVPEAVSLCLEISPLNFAGQFDGPYLLGASAGQVARALGELTNVTVVFEAAREAIRVKGRLADQLRDREVELAGLRQQVRQFAGMQQRLAAVREAESALERATQLQARVTRLRQLMQSVVAAQVVLDQAGAAVREVPSLERLAALTSRRSRFEFLMSSRDALHSDYLEADSAVAAAQERALGLEREHRRLLEEAGVCPTCGQAVH
jgi:DNA repair protein SbcC/Rad50